MVPAPNTSALAPDVAASSAQIQSTVSAAVCVSTYCQATVTLLPPFTSDLNDPTVQTDIGTLEQHAQQWFSGLCDRVASAVPQGFVDFGGAFAAAVGGLDSDVATLESNPGDAAALASLTAGLSQLTTSLQTLGSSATTLRDDLKAFLTTLDSDAQTIANDLVSVEKSIPSGSTIVTQLRGTLATTFYSSELLSSCAVIINIDETVDVSLMEYGATAPSLVPLAVAEAVLSGLAYDAQAAETSLAALGDSLATLVVKYQTLLASIQGAATAQLPPILRQLDLQTATTSWQQLAQFASSLLSSP